MLLNNPNLLMYNIIPNYRNEVFEPIFIVIVKCYINISIIVMSNNNSALAKGLNIISMLSSSPEPCKISSVAQKLGYSVSTTHRILHQLVEYGALQKINKKTFIISSSFYQTVLNIMQNSDLMHQIHFILEQLAEQIQETCNLTTYDKGKVNYFDRVEYNWPHKITIPIGSKLPLYCTASGKLFLSYLDKKYKKAELIDLKPRTKNTINSIEKFKKNLKEICIKKYSLDKQEYMDGMDAIAVPVFTKGKKVPIFVLSVHAPVTRKNYKKLLTFLPQIRASAKNLSSVLNKVIPKL